MASKTHRNTLQHTSTHCNIMQRTATHCNTLQHTATHCNTLQHAATQTCQRVLFHTCRIHCGQIQGEHHVARQNGRFHAPRERCTLVLDGLFYESARAEEIRTAAGGLCVCVIVAVCCSVLQCVCVCCSVLQRVTSRPALKRYEQLLAVCVRVCMLRYVCVCCSVLQCVAVCCGVLQCVAVCCSVLQCVAIGCGLLQCGTSRPV